MHGLRQQGARPRSHGARQYAEGNKAHGLSYDAVALIQADGSAVDIHRYACTHMYINISCSLDGQTNNQATSFVLASAGAGFTFQNLSTGAEWKTARGYECIFYPEFHYELNYIEFFWGAVKRYTRENCNHSFVDLEDIYSQSRLELDFPDYNLEFCQSV